ncbi:MAG: AI-2E family transporter [Deltaproteobacteria bacterium]|jgi:predicted PurR-regulated permease PerM|nr:AI-2E family transporter [Deltaproteobacteria bacterium]
MSFNILEFARLNKIVFIWTAFGALIYLLRDLFGLVFITFVLSFVVCSVARFFTHVLKVKRRRVVVCGIYAVLIASISCFLIMGFPKILAEAKEFTLQLPDSIDKVEDNINSFKESNPSFAPFLERAMEGVTLDALVSRGWSWGRALLSRGWHYISWFFIAIIFSFLIVFDLPDLIQKFRSLRYTRLGAIYDETVSGVIQFAKVVGENFKAQIYISAINTAFTFVGLTIIGTGMTALLSVVVFACGLIPVMGVFISSVPIMLVALNAGGTEMLAYSLILIVVIHAVEAYILNPRIVSSVLHINPVITLMILYIAHSIMGVWGMFLGVPISVYIYAQIVSVKHPAHAAGQSVRAANGAVRREADRLARDAALAAAGTAAAGSPSAGDAPETNFAALSGPAGPPSEAAAPSGAGGGSPQAAASASADEA